MHSEQLASLLARCAARAAEVRQRGARQVVLDTPLLDWAAAQAGRDSVQALARVANIEASYAGAAEALDGYGAATSGDYWDLCACVSARSRVEIQAEIDAALVAQGVIVTSDPAYIAVLDSMSCWDDAPGGARGVRLGEPDILDYEAGYALDDYGYLDYGAISLRNVSPEASDRHYYRVGHGLYRRAVALYGALGAKAAHYLRFSNPEPSTHDLAQACAGRSTGRVQHSAQGRAVLKQARADSLALGSE